MPPAESCSEANYSRIASISPLMFPRDWPSSPFPKSFKSSSWPPRPLWPCEVSAFRLSYSCFLNCWLRPPPRTGPEAGFCEPIAPRRWAAEGPDGLLSPEFELEEKRGLPLT